MSEVKCEFVDDDGTKYRIEESGIFADAWLLTKEKGGHKEVITHFQRWTSPELRLVEESDHA